MDQTVTLYSLTGNETLTFRVQDAHGALFEGQKHSWVEHVEDGKRVATTYNTHMWHDNEEGAQLHHDRQVKSALALGWVKDPILKKKEQLRLF